MWFMGLPNPTAQQSAFVGVATAIIPAVIGLYQSSGRSWNGKAKEPIIVQPIQAPIIPQSSTQAVEADSRLSDKEKQEQLYRGD